MVEAYILLTTDTGMWRNVAEDISEMEETKKVERITGDYDIIAMAEARDMNTLTETVVEEIHQIAGVTDTTTAIIVG